MSNSFFISEVARHKDEDDAWLVIDGKIYDITYFLEEHPGGKDVLIDVLGKDATSEFDAIGHSHSAKQQLDEYYIGDLAVPPAAGPKATGKKSIANGATENAGGFAGFAASLGLTPKQLWVVIVIVAMVLFFLLR